MIKISENAVVTGLAVLVDTFTKKWEVVHKEDRVAVSDLPGLNITIRFDADLDGILGEKEAEKLVNACGAEVIEAIFVVIHK